MNQILRACCLLFSLTAFADGEIKEFEGKSINQLKVENMSGETVIKGNETDKAVVNINKETFSEKCKLTTAIEGKTLVVKVERANLNSWFNTECEVDFKISLPKTVNLDLNVGTGKLKVSGIQGTLNFNVGSGDITADGDFKKINGSTGSGDVDVKGLSGGGEIETGSGGVHLTYAVSPAIGDLKIETGSGNSTLLFPKGAKVKTSFETGSGELQNDLGDTDKAPFKVSVKAGSGNLKVKSY